jgi:phage terminase Nu1 subunit (DNA packaging protein)
MSSGAYARSPRPSRRRKGREHEQPDRVTTQQSEIARHLDLSPRRVRELVRDGVLPQGVDLDTARCAYLRHLREQAAGRRGNAAGSSLDLTAERAALARAQRQRVEMENAARAGRLLEAADVSREFANIIKIVVAGLETLPDVLDRDTSIGHAAVVRVREVVDRLREELYQKLAAEPEPPPPKKRRK